MNMEMEFYTWKEEPVSPTGQDFPDESWLLFEDEEVKLPALKNEPLESVWLPESPSDSSCSKLSKTPEPSLSPSERAQLASKLLIDLEQEENLFDNDNHSLWYEEKTGLIFDELPSPPTPGTSPTRDCHITFAPITPTAITIPYNVTSIPQPPPPKMELFGPAMSIPLTSMVSGHVHVHGHSRGHDVVTLMPAQVVPEMVVQPNNDTATLLQEFENVYDETVMTLGALTPPQSPPSVTVLHELKPASPKTSCELILPDAPPPPTPMAVDLTELEEIVRARAEETVFPIPSPSPSPSPSPASPTSATSASLEEPSPSPSPSSNESSDDPDWVPSPVAAPPISVSRGRGRKRGSSSSKPYSRVNHEDKKLRKKEQNKNAATRYRLKKKMEVEEILGEEQELQDTNDQLKQRVTELSQEIKYLKDLMREVCRAKGLIK